jgi:hypothetical protein
MTWARYDEARRKELAMVRPLAILFILCLTGCALDPQTPSGAESAPGGSARDESAQTARGRVGSHGMVLMGTPSAAFLSHIPMFHAPHDVQAIVAVELSGATMPASFSDQLYTFLPETLSLDALRLGSLRTMRGTIYLGDFEDGGRPVARDVVATVSRVVHQHVLTAGSHAPELGYFVFGTRNEAFAAHRIAGAPGFDQLVRVSVSGADDAALASGILGEATGTPDEIAARLDANPVAPPVFLSTAGGARITVTPRNVLSCLVGPDFFQACAGS